jgi:hypothetical protein
MRIFGATCFSSDPLSTSVLHDYMPTVIFSYLSYNPLISLRHESDGTSFGTESDGTSFGTSFGRTSFGQHLVWAETDGTSLGQHLV